MRSSTLLLPVAVYLFAAIQASHIAESSEVNVPDTGSAGQVAPQDQWFRSFRLGEGPEFSQVNIEDVALGQDGKIYVLTSGDRILLHDAEGRHMRDIFLSPDKGYVSLAVDSAGLIYALNMRGVDRFSSSGEAMGSVVIWSYSPGLRTRVLRIGPDGNLWFATGFTVNCYTTAGALVRKFGEEGEAPGQLYREVRGIAFGPDDRLYVSDISSLQEFLTDGTYVREIDDGIGRAHFGITSDGLLVRLPGILSIQTGELVGYYPDWGEVVVGNNDELFIWGSLHLPIDVYQRSFRTKGDATFNQPPRPYVEKVVQQPGSTMVDIDFIVRDADDATVEVHALAFSETGLYRLSTFATGDEANFGEGIPTNTPLHVAWDAGEDLAGDTENVRIKLLAKDSRENLLDLHFLKLPGLGESGGDLQISRSPVSENELMSLFYWLVAKGDTDVALVGSAVHGLVGQYQDEPLTSPNTDGVYRPTALGRQFLFERMGVREATLQELTRAREANTPGLVQQFEFPAGAVGPGRYPRKVNAYGFDTETYGPGYYWVVKENL